MKQLDILDRLRIWQKLAIVVLASMVPLSLTTYFLLDEKNIRIEFAQWELHGDEYLRPCAHLLQHLASYRSLAHEDAASRSVTQKQRVAELRSLIDADLRAIEAVDAKFGAHLKTSSNEFQARQRANSSPSALRGTWNRLESTPSEPAAFDKLVADVRGLIAHVGDSSKLILDPDLDTYYTMDGLLLRGPELVDRVTALGDQTAAILAKGAATSEERSALSEASALLQFHLDGLEVDVKTAIQEAPGLSNHEGLGPALTPSMGRVGAEVRSLLDVTIELAKTGKSSASPAEVVEATDRALSAVGSHWQTLLDQEDTMLSIRMHGDLRRRAFALWSVLVAVLGTFGLTFLVLRSITVPIQRAADVAKQLARGELPESVEVSKATDEPGELLRAVNDMLRFLDLRRTMRSLQESGQMLAAAVAQLEAQTTEQAEAATRQAAALQETQVTSQEIRQTSKVAAEKAQGVLQAAEKADAVSRSGETAIERSIGGLADIRGQVEQTVDKIAELEKRTQQIGFITQTVKDLADQSNMLALNAAIEAVRSGEHGKGFAVVAREIRNLADQSIQATNRVTEILDSVLLSIREAVAMTGSGRERVEAGSVEIKSSGESLRELSRVVRDSSHSVRQIAAAVGQQDAGINQIFIALGDQSTLMDQTVRRLDDSRRAVSTVRDVVGRVTEIVGRFQT